jgi:hypothetical protein
MGPGNFIPMHILEIFVDGKTGNLELSEWIWQNVEKRCSAA